MASVLERLERLIALTESPNANEARNAAMLAVRLIREHHIKLALPAEPKTRPSPSGGVRKKTPGSARSKRAPDTPTEIKSPLGGDCVECGGRYRAGSQVFWMQSGGGMHPKCFEAWMKRR
jgi:hypothetical protein